MRLGRRLAPGAPRDLDAVVGLEARVRERARQLGEEGGFEYAEGFKTFDLRDDDQDATEPV